MSDDTPPPKPRTARKSPTLKAVPPPVLDVPAKAATALRKKDLLDRVGAVAKAKKKDVKDVVEATLMILGEALARGEELNLPPFGKAKVARQKSVKGGDLFILKLRRGGPGTSSDAAAVRDAED